MDLRVDNPVGRVPDFSRTRRVAGRFTASGWQIGRRRGPWGDGSLLAALPVLDRVHELCLSGPLPPAHVTQIQEFTNRAIARGTFTTRSAGPGSGEAIPEMRHLPPSVPSLRAGDLDWDVAAVHQRRAVLSTAIPRWPSLSAVLVSKRSDLIVPMVQRLAAMDYPDLEIVVGLHGCDVPPGVAEAAGDRPVSVHSLPADMVFGAVLAEVFSRAGGELVTKIDDDDHYGDEHLSDLVLAHEYSGATLVGKATTVVFLEALNATVRRVFGRWETFTHRVAGGTMLLSAEDLRELDGWPHVPRGVDTALLARVAEAGGSTYYPHDVGYLYVRDADGDHTWDTDVSHFLRNTRQQWVGLHRHHAFGTLPQT